MPLYSVPEGYYLDEASGLYYQVNHYQGQDHRLYQQVIWFNTMTGEYTQNNYEIPSANGEIPDGKEQIATEQAVIEEQKKRKGWMIWALILIVATGVAIWYFKPYEHWMNDKKEPEKMIAQKEDHKTECALTVEPMDDHAAIIRLTVPNLMYSYESFLPEEKENIMTYRWAVEFDQYAVAVTHVNHEKTKGKMYSIKEMQNSIWEIQGNESHTIGNMDSMKLDGKTFVWSIHMEDVDFSKLDKFTVDIKIPGFSYHKVMKVNQVIKSSKTADNPVEGSDNKGNAVSYPHANLYYMLADSDDQYIYMIHQRDSYWKFQMEGARGSIYRMKKDGSSENMEKIICSQSNPESISSLAVDKNYIYYAVNLMRSENGQDRYGFFRVNKKGGEAEFLFENEFSYIREYEGMIYFVFPEQALIGILNPKDKKIEYKKIDVTQIADIMSGGSKSEYHCFTPFSVDDGKVYFGGYFEQTYFYNTYQLSSNKLTTIKSGLFDMISENDEGRVMVYGLNPIFIQGESLMNPDANGYLSITKSKYSCFKEPHSSQYLIVQFDPQNAEKSISEAKSMAINSSGDAYGVSGDWLLFSDQFVLLKDGVIYKQKSPDRVEDVSNRWNIDDVMKKHM